MSTNPIPAATAASPKPRANVAPSDPLSNALVSFFGTSWVQAISRLLRSTPAARRMDRYSGLADGRGRRDSPHFRRSELPRSRWALSEPLEPEAVSAGL